MEENWNELYDYLIRSRFLLHNDDYLEFLITKVWKLNKVIKVVDFGCGYGYFGLKLMPLIPKDSSYTGVDKAENLLEKARNVYAHLPYESDFVESSIYNTPFPDSTFDVAVTHAVLMHTQQPGKVIREMIRVTKNGGMIITCDANRNTHNSLFYIAEENSQENIPLPLFQQMNKDEREKSGRDYNIGIKTPVLLHKAGLKNVQCRVSDAVRPLLPPLDTQYKERLFKALCEEGLDFPSRDEKEIEKRREKLLAHGADPKDVEKQIQMEIDRSFKEKGSEYHTVFTPLLSFSFGTVNNVTRVSEYGK